MSHPALRLTPSNSPFFKSPTPRSPTKVNRPEEPGLRLSKVIGTTTTSSNGFDCLPAARKFAYVAGAAAVVATVDEDLKVTQRFFRARPTTAGAGRETNGQWPLTPTLNEARNRTPSHLKEGSYGGSPLGASARDWSDSPTGRTTTAKDRVKAATSVTLSPNGKWLAIGETGYKPRILIFGLAEDCGDAPITAIAEHTFGVHLLSFSPDSKYLASLGTVNDGFLYIWSVDEKTGSATLHASNKCTTLTNCMKWMGSSIISAGLRYVKVWRPDEDAGPEVRRTDSALSPLPPRHRADNRSSEFGNSIFSPKHRVLSGKNSLLGDMLEANFVSVIPTSDTEAIICAESGEICLLNDAEKAQTLTCVGVADSLISAASIDSENSLHILGANDHAQNVPLDTLRSVDAPVRKQARKQALSSPTTFKDNQSTVFVVTSIANATVEISSRDGIRITNNSVHATAISNQLPAHGDAVLGVQPLRSASLPEAAFLTFSGNGIIRIWDAEGSSLAMLAVPLEAPQDIYEIKNDLKAVAPLSDGSMIATGDRYGTLTVIDIRTNTVVAHARAHSTEITDFCAFTRAGAQLLATSSRDRTVQLFAWKGDKLDLLQTLDEHAGAVTQICATKDAAHFLSCSADRTVVVREAMLRDESDPCSVVFVMLRAINLKSAPTSICLADDDGSILVATTDRMITKYSVKSGRASTSFKCSDPDNGEAAILSKIRFSPSLSGSPAIVGVASTDKSVRLYTEFGTLVARDWGHTEGITDVALLPQKSNLDDEQQRAPQLVTVAADSTVFLWDTVRASPSASRQASGGVAMHDELTPGKPSMIGPPLRKIISHTELSRFRRETSVDEGQPASPTASRTPTQQASPQRLRKTASRMSVTHTPKFDPAFRSNFVTETSSRRQSLRQRSPSPPSPRNAVRKEHLRRPSMGMSLRTKSSENVLHMSSTTPAIPTSAATGFGSLTASTESVCRTLRAYRKKLAAATANDSISPDALRDVEKELKLTARVLSEKSRDKGLDEAMMTRLLDQASEKFVGMLDERIKEQVENEVRKSSEGSPASALPLASPTEDGEHSQADALAGALKRVQIAEPLEHTLV